MFWLFIAYIQIHFLSPWRGFILQTIGIDFYGNDIANAKHNPQQQSSLQYRSCLTLWQHIAVALDHMHLTRQQQKRRKLECADLFHADYLRWSQNSKRGRPAVHCHFPLDLHFATTQPCFCKDFKHVFYKPHYVVWGSDKQKSYTKSDLNGQTGTDFQISDLNFISHFAGAWNGFVKIVFSHEFFSFKLAKYDRIPIGCVQKSDSDWQD